MSVTFTNNATSTLAAAITADQLTITVQAHEAAEFPVTGGGLWFPVTLVDRAGTLEIVHCTARDGASLTVMRGREGTTARAFVANSIASHRLTAAALQALIVQGVVVSETPPAPPLMNGQLWWESDSGMLFVWYDDGDSAQWVQVGGGGGGGGGGGSSVFSADVPPVPPLHSGQLWWNSTTGNLYIWYEDVDSSQWVQINSAVSAGGGSGDGVPTIADAIATSFPSSTLVVGVQSYSAAPIRGGAHYRRVTATEASPYPARAKFRSLDRNLPNGSSDAATGGWWLLHEPRPSPFMLGGIGDGVADDVTAINDAITYLHLRSAGGEVDMAGGRWLIDGGDILLKSGVSLVGNWYNAGHFNDATYLGDNVWSFEKSSLIVNSAYTVRFVGDCAGLVRLMILRKGLTQSLDMTQALASARAFAGTAVTIGDGSGSQIAQEAYVGYCFIAGFNQAINCDFLGRVHIEYVSGDNNNGIRISKCYDMAHLSHCHFWPFAAGPVPSATYLISNAVNNGSGLIRLTLAAHVLTTGDWVFVSAVYGTVEANHRWKVTVINATTIDLQGSVFVNAYIPGTGQVVASPGLRQGTAYFFDVDNDLGQADSCFAFGYHRGFDIYQSSNCELLNCGADHGANDQPYDAIGILVRGTAYNTKLVGCKTAAMGIGVVVDVGTNNQVTVLGHDAWGTRTIGIQVLTGFAIITGSVFYNVLTCVDVAPNSDGVLASGNRGTYVVVKGLNISGPALYRSTFVNNTWPDDLRGDQAAAYPNTVPTSTRLAVRGDGGANYLLFQQARGTPAAMAASQDGDCPVIMRGEAWDGTQFRPIGSMRAQAQGAITPSSTGGAIIFNVVPSGSTTGIEAFAIRGDGACTLAPGYSLGVQLAPWANTFSNRLSLLDAIAAPAVNAAYAQIYVDAADGDLKVKFADGVVKTIAVDT